MTDSFKQFASLLREIKNVTLNFIIWRKNLLLITFIFVENIAYHYKILQYTAKIEKFAKTILAATRLAVTMFKRVLCFHVGKHNAWDLPAGAATMHGQAWCILKKNCLAKYFFQLCKIQSCKMFFFSPTKCIFRPTKCIVSPTFRILSLTFWVRQNAF
jgi:hypothetical protein